MRTARRATAVVAALVALLLGSASCGSDAPSAATSSTAVEQPVNTLVPCGTSGTFAYAAPPGVDPDLTSLDVYRPPADGEGCRDRPLVVWVHGGGWTSGDKSEFMTDKVSLFNGAGYVFASINYRLTDKGLPVPAPQYPVHDQDAADALAWLIEHADEIGADPNLVVVLGHSAGGGIVAAISTDDRYLGASGLGIDAIDCAGSMDGEGYDIVAGATTSPVEVQAGYQNVFGTDPAVWPVASPIRHVAPDKGIPRFFIAARGGDWRLAQHLAFIEALRLAAVPTTVLDSTTLEHADLATQIGAPGDTLVTPALMDFIGGCVSR